MRTLRRLSAPVLLIAALSGGGANWDGLTSRVSASHSVPLTVTITRVQALVDEADEGLEALGEGTADLYAVVQIDFTSFSSFDVHQDDNPLIEPFWVFSKMVPGEGTRIVSISIRDHDDTSDDDLADASPAVAFGDVILSVDMATGRWTGDVTWPTNCAQGTGSDGVRVCWDISVLSPTGDADGDGLLDGWEVDGLDADGDGTVDVPLNAWGANPRHKDLFLEFDWMTGQAPTRAAIQAVKAAFAAAPATAGGVMNPDGLPGINLWIDTGNLTDPTAQEDGAAPNSCGDGVDNGGDGAADAADPDCLVGDNLGGGNAIPGFFACLDANFFNAKAVVTNFNPLRRWVFRYGMSGQGDGIPVGGCNGGQGEIGGNDFIEHNVDGGTIMHELGHTLNLRHGGNVDDNCKPNYISVMDYDEQFGINQAGGGRIFDYSPPRFAGGRGAAPLATIVENTLNETQVLDASDATNRVVFTDANGNKVQSAVNGPLDFDGNGTPNGNPVIVNVDTNATGAGPAACANGTNNSTLGGFDDWSNIALGFRQFGDSASGAINPTDQEPTTEELLALRDALNRTDTAITISDSPDPVAAGEVLTYTVTVANNGPNPASRPRVVAVLPAGVTVLDNTGGCLEDPALTLTCDLAEIVARTNRVFTIRVRVAADLVYNNGAPLTVSASANVTNAASSQEIEGANNAASAGTRVVAVADLAIVSFAPFNPPSEVLVGVPVTITMRKTVTNRGPSAPMDVKLARTASSPPDAVISPTGSTEVATAVTLHEHRVVDELFTITCNGYSNHTFTFTNTISPDRPDDTDPDLSNNRATAALTFECVVPVAINNKPGSDPNSTSLRGDTPVAVLTTNAGEYGLPLGFDATRIDPLSVRFGREDQLWEASSGAPEVHARGHVEDGYELDERTLDGDQDMVLHFRNDVSGLTPGSDRACVKGTWRDAGGLPHKFFGCDAIVLRP